MGDSLCFAAEDVEGITGERDGAIGGDVEGAAALLKLGAGGGNDGLETELGSTEYEG